MYITKNKDNYKNSIGEFIIGKSLGEGTFGKVILGTHTLTGEKVAIKVLEKVKILDDSDRKRIDREIKILKTIMHHNVIRLYSVIETQTTINLIMEYASGGELFDLIIMKKRLSEGEACKYFQQLINGIEYLHINGVVHRDLKPENLLLDYKKDVKIVDFGLSNTYKKGEMLKTSCGSPCYAAPEMIAGKRYHSLLVDIWSAGIVLFAMLCGYLPFDEEINDVLYKKIIEGKYTIPEFLSPKAKDLIKNILVTDPRKRYNIQQIRSHPWFNILKAQKCQGLFLNIHIIPIDDKILNAMQELGFSKDEVKQNLKRNKHNHITTTYYLVLKSLTRKGKTSVSDMVSEEFYKYINDPNNFKDPSAHSTIEVDTSIQYLDNCINTEVKTSDRNTLAVSLNTDNYLQCEESNNRTPEETVINLTSLGDNNDQIKPTEYSAFFHTDVEEIKRDNANKKDTISIRLKEQYEKYILRSNKFKIDNFKKNFIDTSLSFEKSKSGERRNKTYDNKIDDLDVIEEKKKINTIKIPNKFLKAKNIWQIELRKKLKNEKKKIHNTTCPEILNKSTEKINLIKDDEDRKNIRLKTSFNRNLNLTEMRSLLSTSTKSTNKQTSGKRCISEGVEREKKLVSSLQKNIKEKEIKIKNKIYSQEKGIKNGYNINILKVKNHPIYNLVNFNNKDLYNYRNKADRYLFKQNKSNNKENSLLSINIDDIKIHKGPIDINCLTFNKPIKVVEDIIFSLHKLKIAFKQSSDNRCNFRCQKYKIKFEIELCKIQNLYIIHFNKIDGNITEYREICKKVLSILNL